MPKNTPEGNAKKGIYRPTPTGGKASDVEQRVAEFSYQNDALADLIVKAWTDKPFRDALTKTGGEPQRSQAAKDALDDRGTNEHTLERAATQVANGEGRLERLALTAVAVPPHADVEQVELALIGPAVDDLMGEEDQARAGRERGHAAAHLLGQRLAQTGRVEQRPECGSEHDSRAGARYAGDRGGRA